MTAPERQMARLTRGLPTTSAKIRKLAQAGFARADIARFLGTRYQHVRKVLVDDETREARRAAETAGTTAPDSAAEGVSLKVRLGPDGRVVIPASFRDKLGLKEGDVLFARLDGGEVHLLTPKAASLRAQQLLRQFIPEGVSLVDELIAGRRREAEREEH